MNQPVRRSILHVDMDAFYAAVEQRDDPALRGQPLAVGGTGTRGVVAAASYEARRFGVRSAMPLREALRRCPQLLRVKPRMEVYRRESGRIFEIFQRYTPQVEGLSLDEAFLDVTASLSIFGSAHAVAVSIKRQIHDELGLTASVGIAPNKLVAKIASDLDKPDGLVEVTAESLHSVLDPLPVRVLPGLGPRTLPGLARLGVRTLGELRTMPATRLRAALGRDTEHMQRRAAGQDDRPVTPERAEKSISAEETFDIDLVAPADLQRALSQLSERTAARLRAKGLLAGTVTVKIREHDFTTVTRQQGLAEQTCQTRTIMDTARRLLVTWHKTRPGARVRLLGVGVSALSHSRQPGLFDVPGDSQGERLDAAADRIRARFGSTALSRARSLR
ncbi:MAG: DNA polymerase IV [Gammaproteobacteria bacterium]|nr:DNA polymerase IV [Gammaproteobacteria bacterium]